jgi:AcrR family transcriptional regulator
MSSGERRDEIVTVAAQLFDESSFAGVTMDDIAKRIGIAKPTLYHYYASKDEILHAIHEEFIELLLERHEAREGSGLRPEQLLLEAMADILELMQTHRGHVRVFFEHHRELTPDARNAIRGKRDQYEQLIEQLIVDSVDRNAFRPVNPRLATLAVFGMCNWAYQWYRSSGAVRPREIAYLFWNYIVFGFASPELRNENESLPPTGGATP